MISTLEQFEAVSHIFDAAKIVLYVADMETHELLFFNRHAEEIWGRDWAGKRCYAVLQAGQTGECAFCTNHRLVENGRAGPPVVWEFQNTVNRRWYLCIDKAIPWTGERLVRMEVAIDITQQKEHEQFRKHYIELISHDLRSPLAAIGFGAAAVEHLLSERGLTAEASGLGVVMRGTRRMEEMIEDLLESTRLESGQFGLNRAPLDLNALAAEVGERLGRQASRVVRIEAGTAATIHADAGRMERVLENLVGNALRYSAPASPVVIEIKARGREVELTVADSGPGIPAEEIPKLFQRYYRARRGRGGCDGLGLGLYIARLIVERHGGRIWADSKVGHGSRFSFALPLAPPDG